MGTIWGTRMETKPKPVPHKLLQESRDRLAKWNAETVLMLAAGALLAYAIDRLL